MVKYTQIIKVIGVDIGGVIIPNLDDEIDKMVSHELGLERLKFDKLWSENIDYLVTGAISEEEFWSKIGRITGKDISRAKEALVNSYTSSVCINLDFVNFLQSISGQFKIAAMSNSINPHSQFNYKNDVYEVFHRIFLSDEIGYKKPDKEFFSYVVDSLEILPQQLLFIDDKIENTVAARKLKINTINFTSNELAVSQIRKFIS